MGDEKRRLLTSTLDPTSYPEDGDGDGLCDGLDQVDDSEIFLVFGSTSQLLFVNEPIEPMVGNLRRRRSYVGGLARVAKWSDPQWGAVQDYPRKRDDFRSTDGGV